MLDISRSKKQIMVDTRDIALVAFENAQRAFDVIHQDDLDFEELDDALHMALPAIGIIVDSLKHIAGDGSDLLKTCDCCLAKRLAEWMVENDYLSAPEPKKEAPPPKSRIDLDLPLSPMETNFVLIRQIEGEEDGSKTGTTKRTSAKTGRTYRNNQAVG